MISSMWKMTFDNGISSNVSDNYEKLMDPIA